MFKYVSQCMIMDILKCALEWELRGMINVFSEETYKFKNLSNKASKGGTLP